MIRSAVLIQYTRVTDGQKDRRTDRIGVAYTRYSIYAVARKNGPVHYLTIARVLRIVYNIVLHNRANYSSEQRIATPAPRLGRQSPQVIRFTGVKE